MQSIPISISSETLQPVGMENPPKKSKKPIVHIKKAKRANREKKNHNYNELITLPRPSEISEKNWRT